jgi:hypothetical protein
VCASGELMCNPGYYDHQQRGLAGQLVCFGVLPAADGGQLARWAKRLVEHGLAHSLSAAGRLWLLLCPALRALLRGAGGKR